jgi:membrane-bound serine protease (ClpP class)
MPAKTNLRSLLSVVGLAAVISSGTVVCAAQEQQPNADDIVSADVGVDRFARLVRIPLPIRGTVDTQVRLVLEQILSSVPDSEARPIVVLEFWPPPDGQGDSSEFGRSLDLARFLASPRTSGVRTVAYVPKTIRGHAVLVALACE